MLALCKAVTSARRAVTDTVFKDMLKQMKSGLTDKTLPVQRAAAEVYCPSFPSLNSFTYCHLGPDSYVLRQR